MVGPFPTVVDGYALPLQGPGLGVWFDEELAAKTPFKPTVVPELRALDGAVRDF
jgi:mannonate dehydratase